METFYVGDSDDDDSDVEEPVAFPRSLEGVTEAAEELKRLGNDFFKQQDYRSAPRC